MIQMVSYLDQRLYLKCMYKYLFVSFTTENRMLTLIQLETERLLVKMRTNIVAVSQCSTDTKQTKERKCSWLVG